MQQSYFQIKHFDFKASVYNIYYQKLNFLIMKRTIFFLTVVLLLIITMISCKKVPVEGVNIDKSTLLIYVGETAILTASIVPPNAHNHKVNWESTDTNVATVENGIVTGIAAGMATIIVIAQENGRTATCSVVVMQPIEPEMVWVEGGTFTMGCTDEQGEDCFYIEIPNHQVTLSGFYIGKYEVTNKEWTAVMGNTPSLFTGDNLPVHNIFWNGVQEYINRLNTYTGKNYRLPTEAEWEYAARGGNKSDGYKYSGSNFAASVAWYSEGVMLTSPQNVGKKSPNELGIYDMSGNVWEWCSDWYDSYTSDPLTNPTGPPTGIKRNLRGGSWTNVTWFCRVSNRTSWEPQYVVPNGGFRLVLSEK